MSNFPNRVPTKDHPNLRQTPFTMKSVVFKCRWGPNGKLKRTRKIVEGNLKGLVVYY